MTYSYCCQCTDRTSGKIGDFVFSDHKPFEAISPVFDDLGGLFIWMNQNGFKPWHYQPDEFHPWACQKVVDSVPAEC